MIGYQLLNNNKMCYNPKHKFFGERAQVAYEPLPRKKKGACRCHWYIWTAKLQVADLRLSGSVRYIF